MTTPHEKLIEFTETITDEKLVEMLMSMEMSREEAEEAVKNRL